MGTRKNVEAKGRKDWRRRPLLHSVFLTAKGLNFTQLFTGLCKCCHSFFGMPGSVKKIGRMAVSIGILRFV